MANYNSGYIYNAKGEDGGFFWNGASYTLLLKFHETLKTIDGLSLTLAKLVLSEKINIFYEKLITSVFYGFSDDLNAKDEIKYFTLFSLADKFGVKDKFSDLIVLAHIEEKQEFIDAVRQFAQLISVDEEIILKNPDSNIENILYDNATVLALTNLADEFGVNDVIDFVQFILTMRDKFGMTDGELSPKTAISDWIIGVTDELDNAYDYIIPFNMKVDWDNTNIAVMPETEIITAELAGIDGSLWEDCTYKDRLFSITAYSEQGLTVQQKEELKTKITEILDSTKHQSKKLTVQDRGVSFDVKYTGQAEITEAPSFVKMRADLLAQPYGYRTFEEEIIGSGLVDNTKGDAPLGPIVKISGPCVSPSFSLGDYQYSWSGTVKEGYTLVIDFNMLTCYLIDLNNKKTNAMNKFNGQFHKIKKGDSEIIQIPDDISNQIRTSWRTKVLW